MPPTLIERKTYHCLYCDENFKSGDWFGCANSKFRKHQVEPVTYHSTHDGHVICVIKESKGADPTTGQSYTIPGTQAMFVNGHYTTSDPEQQEKLEVVKANGGLVSMEVYVNSKLTTSQRAQRAEGQLSEKSKLLEDKQTELDDLRAENARLKAASPEDQEVPAGVIPGSGGLPGTRSKRA